MLKTAIGVNGTCTKRSILRELFEQCHYGYKNELICNIFREKRRSKSGCFPTVAPEQVEERAGRNYVHFAGRPPSSGLVYR
jgi:hypothetical protein